MLKEATRCLARSCGPLDLQTSVETIKKDKKKEEKKIISKLAEETLNEASCGEWHQRIRIR